MALRRLGACAVLASLVFIGGATASGADRTPQFSLSATAATVDDDVALRVETAPRPSQREIRLYLVPAGVTASTVRSRTDPRLSFIGFARGSRGARLVFTVPPLETGNYALAYWCRGCLPRGKSIAVQSSTKLRVRAPTREGCATTRPNRHVPPGAPHISGAQWHGNGALWVWLRPDGILTTNALGGDKKPWVGRGWEGGPLKVVYRRLDPPSAPLTASVVSGTLGGYDGPSWASRMSFQPGCWQISGRLWDVSLSFVVQVELGSN
jgi:hypothetical protein